VVAGHQRPGWLAAVGTPPREDGEHANPGSTWAGEADSRESIRAAVTPVAAESPEETRSRRGNQSELGATKPRRPPRLREEGTGSRCDSPGRRNRALRLLVIRP
jgi:hypothetical protein